MWFLRLIASKGRRLWFKYIDACKSTHSPFLGAVYIIRFFAGRLHYLAWHLRARFSLKRHDVEQINDQTRPVLAVMVAGGVGDCLLAALFLRDLAADVEAFVFDIYCASPGTAAWIFSSVPRYRQCRSLFLFDKLKTHYDAAISLAHAVQVDIAAEPAAKLASAPRLKARLRSAQAQAMTLQLYFDKRPTLDNEFAHVVTAQGATRESYFHKIFGLTIDPKPLSIPTSEAKLQQYGLEKQNYVTIHNGHDPNVIVLKNRSTKFYPRFNEVIELLKAQWPDTKFVQIGTQTSAPLAAVDLNLLNQTSLTEAAELIQKARFHIDIESGLVHLAHALGTRSVVLFGPTPVDYFGYAENTNIAPHACGDCWATRETWMAFCPKGFSEPICTMQAPNQIAEIVVSSIRQK